MIKQYSIEWKLSAQKEIKKIDKAQIPKIINAIEKLSFNPYPTNCKI